jgi:hypothetical protein
MPYSLLTTTLHAPKGARPATMSRYPSPRDLVTSRLTGHDGPRTGRSTDLDHCLRVPDDSIHRTKEIPMATCQTPRDLVHTLSGEDRSGAMDQPA